MGWAMYDLNLSQDMKCSSATECHTDSGAHPKSYVMVLGGFSTGIKWVGYQVDDSQLPSVNVKNK
jgi:hypothetical protein